MYSRWKIAGQRAEPPEALLRAGYSPLLAAVLAVRGYATPEAARQFLDVDERLLGDPLMLADMPQAVMRLTRAIAAGEHIAVYGDYDVDGITSTCMLTDYLRRRGVKCDWYIPDRLEEGYGVNSAAIDTLKARGVTLIVTVDCGVTTVEEAAYASGLGVDMIITDHHECRDALPDAIAVVDPKRPDCLYPSHDLAGVGVASTSSVGAVVCVTFGVATSWLPKGWKIASAMTASRATSSTASTARPSGVMR